MHDHGVVDCRTDDDGLFTHGFTAVQDIIEVALVVGNVRFAAVAAVCEILAEIAARNAHLARVHRRIGAVLKRDGQVAVAAVCDVFRRIRVACGAFHKDERYIRFLGRMDAHAVFRDYLVRHGVFRAGGDIVAHEALHGAELALRHVDFEALLERQAVVSVL